MREIADRAAACNHGAVHEVLPAGGADDAKTNIVDVDAGLKVWSAATELRQQRAHDEARQRHGLSVARWEPAKGPHRHLRRGPFHLDHARRCSHPEREAR